MIRRSRTLWLSLVAVTALACGNAFEALLRPVPDFPDELTLADFRTGKLQDASAFDAILRVTARVDQTNQWDFLFFLTEGGIVQLRPFGAVTEIVTDAGLQKVDTSFEGLTEAPSEGYEQSEPMVVAVGDVLAVRSRRDPAVRGRCRRFSKMEILEIDLEARTLTFQHLGNPNCEGRVLIPGERGSL